MMNISEHIEYWLKSADKDLITAQNLFETEDYHWCLYIAHLVIEKGLKALFCYSKQDMPPRTHDLIKLANLTGITLSAEQIEFYHRVNDFNIEARYPDKKHSFYKTATKEFTEPNFKQIKSEYQWIKSLIKF